MHSSPITGSSVSMSKFLGVMAIVGACILTPTFAAQPPASADSQSTATAPSTNSSSTTSSTTSSATTTSSTSTPTSTSETQVKVTAGDDEAAAQLKRFKAAGYKP